MWEVGRIHLQHMYAMNPYVKKKPKTVQQVFKLSWDSKKPSGEQSVENMKNVLIAIHESQKNKKTKGPQKRSEI